MWNELSLKNFKFKKPLKIDRIRLEDSADAAENFQSEITVAHFPRGMKLEESARTGLTH